MTDSDRPKDSHLELRTLDKTYPGGVTAVENLSLSLARGELLVLVGPSGCGKSTTLRCIAGLEEPTDGDILIGRESVTGRRPEDRNIAMVFQNYALYPHKTARQNIGFGLRMTTDLSEETIETRVEDVGDTLGITGLLEKKPGSLSGGQQQRVALGRAIVRDPSVFLLDEPLSNLDATLRSRMRTEIQQLQQVDTPMACYHKPANRFVASFIGDPSMNLLDCRLDRTGTALTGAVSYPLDDRLAAAASETQEREQGVTLGFRPESPTLLASADGDDADALSFTGRVDVVEPVGERSFVYVTLASGPQVTVAAPGGTPVREGASVRVRVPPAGVHLFDAATGEALVHPDRSEQPDVAGVTTGELDRG